MGKRSRARKLKARARKKRRRKRARAKRKARAERAERIKREREKRQADLAVGVKLSLIGESLRRDLETYRTVSAHGIVGCMTLKEDVLNAAQALGQGKFSGIQFNKPAWARRARVQLRKEVRWDKKRHCHSALKFIFIARNPGDWRKILHRDMDISHRCKNGECVVIEHIVCESKEKNGTRDWCYAEDCECDPVCLADGSMVNSNW